MAIRAGTLAALLLGLAACASTPPTDPLEPDPAPDSKELWGMYLYMADAAVFTDCSSGTGFPVDLRSVGIELDRAYVDQRPGPGRPLLASLTGRFVMQSPEPGAAPRPHLVVVEFDRFWPGETCARARQRMP